MRYSLGLRRQNNEWGKVKKFIAIFTAFCVLFTLPQISTASAKPLKNCGAVGYAGGRLLQNVVCKDGSPNAAATVKLRLSTPLMMKLKSNASMHQIYAAVCKDWANSTGPDLMVTYSYLVSLFNWTDKTHLAVFSNYPNCDQY